MDAWRVCVAWRSTRCPPACCPEGRKLLGLVLVWCGWRGRVLFRPGVHGRVGGCSSGEVHQQSVGRFAHQDDERRKCLPPPMPHCRPHNLPPCKSIAVPCGAASFARARAPVVVGGLIELCNPGICRGGGHVQPVLPSPGSQLPPQRPPAPDRQQGEHRARGACFASLSLSHPVLLSPQAAATVAFPVSKKFPCNKHTGAPRRRPAPQAPQALTFAAACGRAPCPRRCAKTGSSSSRTEKSTS